MSALFYPAYSSHLMNKDNGNDFELSHCQTKQIMDQDAYLEDCILDISQHHHQPEYKDNWGNVQWVKDKYYAKNFEEGGYTPKDFYSYAMGKKKYSGRENQVLQYLVEKNVDLDEEIIERFVYRGRLILQKLQENKSPIKKSPHFPLVIQESFDSQLIDIASVCWGLYYNAVSQGSKFIRGSFSYEDQDDNLYNFFLQYVLSINGVKKIEDLDTAIINTMKAVFNARFAYRRISSHYVKDSEDQFGIDARKQDGKLVDTLFPFKMTHLLFGKIKLKNGNHKLFIKCEEAGMGDPFSIADHTINYAKSSKQTGETHRREKDSPTFIIKLIRKFIEINEGSYIECQTNDPDSLNKSSMVLINPNTQESPKFCLDYAKFCLESNNFREAIDAIEKNKELEKSFVKFMKTNNISEKTIEITSGNEFAVTKSMIFRDNKNYKNLDTLDDIEEVESIFGNQSIDERDQPSLESVFDIIDKYNSMQEVELRDLNTIMKTLFLINQNPQLKKKILDAEK